MTGHSCGVQNSVTQPYCNWEHQAKAGEGKTEEATDQHVDLVEEIDG